MSLLKKPQIKFLTLFAVFFILFALPNSIQGVCNPNTTALAGGLISARAVNGFNTQAGVCVKSNDAVIGNLPSFNLLKVTYYDQVNPLPTSSITKVDAIAGPTTNGIDLSGTQDKLYYINGDLTINGSVSGTRSGVVFVNGALIITGNDLIYSPATDNGLVFIVRGNIYISSNIERIDAVLMSTGSIYTATTYPQICNKNNVTERANGGPIRPLLINGSLMTLSSAGSIVFCRNLANNNVPSERIDYQAKYLVILRDLLPYNRPIWQEVTGIASATLPAAPPPPTAVPPPPIITPPPAVIPPPPATYKRVFVTNATYTGNLGGLTGADNNCMTAAASLPVEANWKAWISNGTTSPTTPGRMIQHSGQYRLTDGVTIVANNWSDLIDGPITSINKTELNGTPGGTTLIWTNTASGGGIVNTSNTCTNWGGTSGQVAVGDYTKSGNGWTNFTTQGCSNSARLYCIEQ
jgi:hypothetical protein